jgi:hypothetical protein
MGRTVIVGDVHGCRQELEALLARVAVCGDDRVYFVGDLVARGPDTIGVLDLVIELGARSVRGNHEAKLLSWDEARRKRRAEVPLGPSHQQVVRSMRGRHWKLLRSMPLWIDLPDHDLRIVHAGLIPGIPLDRQHPDVLLTIRGLTEKGEASKLRGSEPWGRRYQGPPHVVFGHHALMAPQMHPWATGIDMGCVYGGFLAALVLRPGEPVPPLDLRLESLVTVPARRAWYPVRERREAV